MTATPRKSAIRIHYIAEWATKLDVPRSEIIEKTGADKSLVSRWFSGTLPGEKYLIQLAAIFDVEVNSLFRDPDDDWIAKWFRDRKADQLQRVLKLMLEIDSGVVSIRRQPSPDAEAAPKKSAAN